MKTTPTDLRAKGFSLIEMIGVLAVLSILAATILPNVMRKIVEANGTKEERNLAVLAEGLTDYIKSRQVIPGGESWVMSVAAMTGLNSNEVARVNPNDPNSTRIYLLHPGFAPVSGSDPILSLSSTGWTAPTNARVMVISATKPGLALPFSSGKAADTASNRKAFEAVWDWNFDPSTKAAPDGWPAAWNQNGEYLRVKRLNLAGLFHHVTMSNTRFPAHIPFARFNDQPVVALDATSAVDAYYLEGTTVRLYKHDSSYAGPPAHPDELDVTHTVGDDVNFIYGGAPGRWSIP